MAASQISKEKLAENWVCWTVMYKNHLPRKPILVKHKAWKRLGAAGAVMGMGSSAAGAGPEAQLSELGAFQQSFWGAFGAAARAGLGAAPEQLGWALHRLPQAHRARLSWEREGKHREGRREAGLAVPPSPPGLLPPHGKGVSWEIYCSIIPSFSRFFLLSVPHPSPQGRSYFCLSGRMLLSSSPETPRKKMISCR